MSFAKLAYEAVKKTAVEVYETVAQCVLYIIKLASETGEEDAWRIKFNLEAMFNICTAAIQHARDALIETAAEVDKDA